MARLVGNTRPRVNLGLWASFVFILALLAAVGTYLLGVLTHLIGG